MSSPPSPLTDPAELPNDVTTTAQAQAYPFGEPVTDKDRLIHRLNEEAFPVKVLGRVDDRLIYTLLKETQSRQANEGKNFMPQMVFPAMQPNVLNRYRLFPTVKPTQNDESLSAEEKGRILGEAIMKGHANIFPRDSQRCIEQ